MEESTLQDGSIEEKVITYSEWNKLIFPSVENKNKNIWNIFKYGTALLLTVMGLMSLWFAAQWQTPNVLGTIGIDVTKWLNYLSSTDTLGNAELINTISKFHLWDLNGAILTQSGVQALVAIGILSLVSIIPLLLFKNGTAWSLGSIVVSWVLLIIVIVLFSFGIVSQSNALKVNTIPLNTVEIDKINEAIRTQQALLIIPGENSLLTPEQQMENNKINNIINDLIIEKDSMLSDFMKTLNDYLKLL